MRQWSLPLRGEEYRVTVIQKMSRQMDMFSNLLNLARPDSGEVSMRLSERSF
jgi:hypothetical protein